MEDLVKRLEIDGQHNFVDKILQTAMAKQTVISPQEAISRGMYGPVFHGTNPEALKMIEDEGFKVFEGQASTGNIQNGFQADVNWGYTGAVPPVHFLGFGIYFTSNKTSAKMYAGGTVKGMKTYYLDTNRIETINFASPAKMLQWWIKNGFDPKIANIDQVGATRIMTDNLKSNFDAVLFTGKGYGGKQLLDGNQICVYDPSIVYEVNNSLAGPYEVGSKVMSKEDGSVGLIVGARMDRTKRDWPGMGYKFPHGETYMEDKYRRMSWHTTPEGKIVQTFKVIDEESPDFGKTFDFEVTPDIVINRQDLEQPRQTYYMEVKFTPGGTKTILQDELYRDYSPI